ncbi:MAG: AMP phosphorylase [Thermoplasmata archaeon]|nr:MAG: AMP phosphorylase [Thermoplasmata archaeon]
MKLKAKILDLESPMRQIALNVVDGRELGLNPGDRVRVISSGGTTTATVEFSDTLVKQGEVALFENLAEELAASPGDEVEVMPTERPESVEYIKKKMKGERLSSDEILSIIRDITSKRLTDIELTAYVVSNEINGMSMEEVEYLIDAMVETGERIYFDSSPIMDHHSVGGVPGNKITLIIVPIVAAAGLKIPKTSSRAISSASGTADTFEVLAPVELTAEQIKNQTESVGGTIAWGGTVGLAPADDIIIRVEYPLSLDPYAQVLASVLSKKKAVGAEYLLMDIPMGPETKVESAQEARRFARDFITLGSRIGIHVECAITYGGQPIGRAVGPALEAREALMALEGKKVPNSLWEKSTTLAGYMLEMGGIVRPGEGKKMAEELVKSGKALDKMKDIIQAQGGDPDVTSEDIKVGKYTCEITASEEGYVEGVSNRTVVKIARAAGAPYDKGAGVEIFKKKGNRIERGEVLLRIYSDHQWKLDRACKLARKHTPVRIEGMILERVPRIHSHD